MGLYGEGTGGAVLRWFRAEDNQLNDAVMDALRSVDDGGFILLLTKTGDVEPGEIEEVALTAGIQQLKAVNVGSGWNGTCLIPALREPKSGWLDL